MTRSKFAAGARARILVGSDYEFVYAGLSLFGHGLAGEWDR